LAPAPTPPTGGISISRIYELGKDALAIAVVPLCLWIVNLSVENALQSERIENLQGEVDVLKEHEVKVDKLREDLQNLAVQQVRVEGKVDLANSRLDDIKVLLAK
jgi:hypothetical protein